MSWITPKSKDWQCSHNLILNPGDHTQTPVMHTMRSRISHSAMRTKFERGKNESLQTIDTSNVLSHNSYFSHRGGMGKNTYAWQTRYSINEKNLQ